MSSTDKRSSFSTESESEVSEELKSQDDFERFEVEAIQYRGFIHSIILDFSNGSPLVLGYEISSVCNHDARAKKTLGFLMNFNLHLYWQK